MVAQRRGQPRYLDSVVTRWRTFALLAAACGLLGDPALAHVGVDTRIHNYDEQIQSNPDSALLYLKRGEAHRENQHWKLAWSDYETALAYADDPDIRLEVFFCMGRMKLQQDQPRQALDLLHRVIDQNPDYKMARLNIARAYLALHNPAMAVDEMDVFVASIAKPAPDYFLERARMAVTIEPSGNVRALDGLTEGIERLGPLVSLVQMAVELSIEMDNPRSAQALVERLPSAVQSLPKWQARLGDIHRQAGQQEAAEAAYRQAMQKIDELPASRQATRAMRSLKEELCVKLEPC